MQSRANLKSCFLVATLVLQGCSATSVDTRPATLGVMTDWDAMVSVLDEPGPIQLEKHLTARWAVDLAGLLNLDHQKAVAAGLENRSEPIEIYTYSLQHPEHGIFLVDSGIAESFRDPVANTDLAWLIKQFMNIDALEVERTTREVLAALGAEASGVFLTHIHIDHIMGLSDVGKNTPVYIGPGDAAITTAENLATRGTTDRLLANAAGLQEWQFGGTGVVDVFGDRSVFAIHSPGHTPGSTAYLVRSTRGPVLLLGDVCHTAWGWENGVEPGSFSLDKPGSAVSLARLIDLVGEHPAIVVHPGHQSLD